MILNNCNQCGRKPDRKTIADENYFECKCGRTVRSLQFSLFWTPEVAADMWNRANPQEEKTMHSDYINYLAEQASEWRPMSAAPTNGDLILARTFSGIDIYVSFDFSALECHWRDTDNNGWSYEDLTGWRPL